MSKGKLSIIIPAYNEEEAVPITAKTVSGIMEQNGIEYEIIFINDGSKDGTWRSIVGACQENGYISGINLSRNFGKEGAVFAGISNIEGDCCVVMDCDLQHPPQTIVEMYNIWKNNDVQIVEGKKKRRQKESGIKKIFANTYYKILKGMTGIDLYNASDFKLLDRQVVDIIKDMPERHTFFRALPTWVGFQTESVYYEVSDRIAGTTKWSLFSLYRLALNSITSFSSAPMQIVSFFGFGFFVFAIILSIQSLINKINGTALEGFTTVIILLLIIGSILMLSLGIIGIYLAKIYDEVKFRPRFIIKEKTEKMEKKDV